MQDTERESEMDVIVTQIDGRAAWELTDLLGRSMGFITAGPGDLFTIHPQGQAVETMAGMKTGPHPSLDAALAEIEVHTRGVCRRIAGADHCPDGPSQPSTVE
jgi:hypothetical protein